VILPILVLIIQGCATSFPNYDTREPFQRSDWEKAPLLKQLRQHQPPSGLFPMYAKGKLDVRQQDRRERGTLELYLYPDSLYAEVKNQVGIAGLRVWMIRDQLIIRDRVENQTYRYTKQAVPDPLIQALVNLPLQSLFLPYTHWEPSDVKRIEENSRYLRMQLKSQRYVLLDRKSLEIKRIDDPQQHQFPFQRIEYQHYRPYGQGKLPRSFRIFQPTAQTDIFLLLQTLKPLYPDQTGTPQWPVEPPTSKD
jgi:hypothetical protein